MDIVGTMLISLIIPYTQFPFQTCDVKKNDTRIANGETLIHHFAEGP
jgi:hypothetical protein